MKLNDMMRLLSINPAERRTVRRILRELEAEGGSARLRGHSYVANDASQVIEGKLAVTRKGFGFVVPDAGSPEAGRFGDIYVSRKGLGDALNGDRVHVRLLPTRPAEARFSGMRREGRIVDVIERATTAIAGIYYPLRKGGQVIPHDTTINRTISVPRPPADLDVQEGAYVMAEVSVWTHPGDPLLGRVTEVLGYPD